MTATTTQSNTHTIWSPSLDTPSPSTSMVRPKSVDPSLLTRTVSQFANSTSSNLNRPPFSSYSSFSSQFTTNSAHTHTRSNSQSGGGAWRPSLTPNPQSNGTSTNGTNGTQHHVRNRARSGTESSSSTSSSSQGQHPPHPMGVAAAAPPFRPHSRLANVSASADNNNNSERRPPSRHQHRKSSVSSSNPSIDNSKANMYQDTMARYQALMRDADDKLQSKLSALGEGRSSSRMGGRRNSSSFFLSSFPGSEKREREREKERIVLEHERAVQEITCKMEEERKTIHREDRKRRRASLSNAPSKVKQTQQSGRGVLVEDDVTLFPLSDDLSPTGDQEEWTWRPGNETGGEFDGPGGEKRREEVRREQQAILDSIKRGNNSSSTNTSPTDSNSSSSGGNRKVRWAAASKRPHSPVIPPRPLSTIPSTSSTVPTLPPTPHTAHLLLQQQQRSGSPFARAASSGPMSAARMSPSIPLNGGGGGVRPPSAQNINNANNVNHASSTRPASARPSSPARMHARWIPSVNDYAADLRSAGGRSSVAAKPVQIPGRTGHGAAHHTHSGSVSTDVGGAGDNGSVGSGSLSGSWRDWNLKTAGSLNNNGSVKSQTFAHAQALEEREKNSWGRRSMTPAPGSSASSRFTTASGGPPVPDIPRKRTLSFSSASAAAAASSNTPAPSNTQPPIPSKVKERDFVKLPAPSKNKAKSAVVDDRDEPLPAPSPALPSDDLVLAPSASSSDNSLHAAPSISRKDKGKGKAKAPPAPSAPLILPSRSPFVELASGGVKSLYAQQIEDLAGQLRRELGVGA